MTDLALQRLILAYLVIVILAQAIFAAFPGMDIAVSGLFADGPGGFGWAGGTPAAINLALRRMGELLICGLVLWILWGGVTGLLWGDDLRAWGYAVCGVALASGGIVNLLLKAHIGRARPMHILEFGGTAQFTPAWQMADQCARNCSFTSGEVAMAASLAISTLVLLWPRLNTPRARVLSVAVASVYVGAVAVLRIGLGRHFLSDAVFSVLVSAGVALVLYPILRISRARHAFDPGLPFETGQRLFEGGLLLARSWWTRAT